MPRPSDPETELEPELKAFLDFMAERMRLEPHLIRPLSWLDRAEELVRGIEVDLDEDLGDEVSLD